MGSSSLICDGGTNSLGFMPHALKPNVKAIKKMKNRLDKRDFAMDTSINQLKGSAKMRFLFLSILLLMMAAPVQAKSISMMYRGFSSLENPINVSHHQFTAPDGQIEKVSDWQGQWVLLNIWATWCAPCIAELPDLAQLSKSNPFPNLKILAVSFDQKRTQEQILSVLARQNLGDFAGYMDIDRQFEKHLKPAGLPRTYLIDPSGYIVADYRGAANWLDPRVFQDLSVFVNSGSTSNISATKP